MGEILLALIGRAHQGDKEQEIPCLQRTWDWYTV